MIDRYATRDTTLGGAEIAAGELVRISITAANRDPETFADPDRFDLGRANTGRHLAFAGGPHVCVGHAPRAARGARRARHAARAPARPAARRAAPEIRGLIFRKPPAAARALGASRTPRRRARRRRTRTPRATIAPTTGIGGPPWMPVSCTTAWPLPRAISQRLTGHGDDAGDRRARTRGCPRTAGCRARPPSRPGSSSMIALSTISITVMLSVSEASAIGTTTREREPGAQQRQARQQVAEEERQRDRRSRRSASSPRPSAVPMTMPRTSPIAQPVRQCSVAETATELRLSWSCTPT